MRDPAQTILRKKEIVSLTHTTNIGSAVDLRLPEPEAFLSYSWNDELRVRDVHDRLTSDGIRCWVDKVDLSAGQVWEAEIAEAIKNCHHFVVFLSSNSVSGTGYVSIEIEKALDVADRQPVGSLFIIPARLEDCPIPERLSHLHWVDLFKEDGYASILAVLRLNPVRLRRNMSDRKWRI